MAVSNVKLKKNEENRKGLKESTFATLKDLRGAELELRAVGDAPEHKRAQLGSAKRIREKLETRTGQFSLKGGQFRQSRSGRDGIFSSLISVLSSFLFSFSKGDRRRTALLPLTDSIPIPSTF